MTVTIHPYRNTETREIRRARMAAAHPVLAAIAAILLLPVISLGGLFGLAYGVLAPRLQLFGMR